MPHETVSGLVNKIFRSFRGRHGLLRPWYNNFSVGAVSQGVKPPGPFGKVTASFDLSLLILA